MREHQAEILTNNALIDGAVYPALIANNIQWIVYSSSSMVFQNPPKFPYTEADITKIHPPSNIYGFAKFIGEYFCRAYHKQYGLSHTIIRYHNIYGPGEDSKGASPGDIHVIPALLEKVTSGQYPLEFLGDPPEKATRPFVYVDDAVEATVAIVERALRADESVRNEDFNIGSDTHYTILELGKLIWKMFGDGRKFKYTVNPVPSDANGQDGNRQRRSPRALKAPPSGLNPVRILREVEIHKRKASDLCILLIVIGQASFCLL